MIRSIEMVTLFHKSVRPWRFTVANGDLYLTYIYDQLQQIYDYQDVPASCRNRDKSPQFNAELIR